MWVRRTSDKFSLLTVGNITYSGDPRIKITFQYPNNWRLHIKPMQKDDAGLYMCQVSTHPPRVFATNVVVLRKYFHSFIWYYNIILRMSYVIGDDPPFEWRLSVVMEIAFTSWLYTHTRASKSGQKGASSSTPYIYTHRRSHDNYYCWQCQQFHLISTKITWHWDWADFGTRLLFQFYAECSLNASTWYRVSVNGKVEMLKQIFDIYFMWAYMLSVCTAHTQTQKLSYE